MTDTTREAVNLTGLDDYLRDPSVGLPWDIRIRIAEALRLQQAEIARLTAALSEIANITERRESKYPADWHDQIAACPECRRYKDHPIQGGICDDHRKPIYEQEYHDRHETKILGYRAKDIARGALAKQGGAE